MVEVDSLEDLLTIARSDDVKWIMVTRPMLYHLLKIMANFNIISNTTKIGKFRLLSLFNKPLVPIKSNNTRRDLLQNSYSPQMGKLTERVIRVLIGEEDGIRTWI